MASESPSDVRKVVIHLRATGDAPILKQQKFKVAGTDKFVSVIDFLRRQLHRDTLFVYVNSAFSPNPDELVMDLYDDSPGVHLGCDQFFTCIKPWDEVVADERVLKLINSVKEGEGETIDEHLCYSLSWL